MTIERAKSVTPHFSGLTKIQKVAIRTICTIITKTVNVIDVTDEDSRVASADEESFYGTILEDILEIIMPSLKDASVMILNGKHKYELATILDFNIAKYEVAVQLDDSKKTVVVIRCDDVCMHG